MAVRLLRGDAALVDEGLHEGVVLGDLGQFPVPKQIAPGVADVHQSEPVTGEQDGGQGGPHALELGVQFDLLGDIRVPLVHSTFQLAEKIPAGLVVVEMGQCGDHELRGDLAGGVPAHAVGQRQ